MKLKKNRKRRILIESLQASVYVDEIQSLAHSHQQHLHRLKNWKELE